MGNSELAKKVFSLVQAKMPYRPSPIEFEMAYQSRVAMSRIRFAIAEIERHSVGRTNFCEATLQLADALDRLESADRHFQESFRRKLKPGHHESGNAQNGEIGDDGVDPQLVSRWP